MKLLQSILIAAAFLLAPKVATAQDDPYYGGFDGRWEGALQFVAPEAFNKDHGYATKTGDYAIAIKGDAVSVYTKTDTGAWAEYMPGGFRIFAHKTNAVIFGSTSSIGDSSQKPSGWVETWNFTITHKDNNGLYIILTRAVNNLGTPYDYKTDLTVGRFFTIGHGEFTRVGAQSVP